MSKPKKRNPLAVGLFDSPIVRPQLTLAQFLMHGADEARVQRAMQDTVAKAKALKMMMLLHAFGIAPDDPLCWEKLSLRLAEIYIPGFSTRSPKRRPGARPKGRSREIFNSVNKLLRHDGRLNKKAAIALIAKQNRWKFDEVKARYYEYRRAHAPLG